MADRVCVGTRQVSRDITKPASIRYKGLTEPRDYTPHTFPPDEDEHPVEHVISYPVGHCPVCRREVTVSLDGEVRRHAPAQAASDGATRA